MVNASGDWAYCGAHDHMRPYWHDGGFSPCFIVRFHKGKK
jgi:hypothetical protein